MAPVTELRPGIEPAKTSKITLKDVIKGVGGASIIAAAIGVGTVKGLSEFGYETLIGLLPSSAKTPQRSFGERLSGAFAMPGIPAEFDTGQPAERVLYVITTGAEDHPRKIVRPTTKVDEDSDTVGTVTDIRTRRKLSV